MSAYAREVRRELHTRTFARIEQPSIRLHDERSCGIFVKSDERSRLVRAPVRGEH